MLGRKFHANKSSRGRQAGPAFERFMLVVAVVEPLMTIPQIIEVYQHKGGGVSLSTWSLYLFASAMWLVYGLKRRNGPLIVSGLLWVVTEAAVVAGALLLA